MKRIVPLLMIAAASSAHAVTVRVGSDAACDAASLPAAIALLPDDGPGGSHLIRLSRNASYTMPATVARRSVVIEGGYDNCADTAADPQTPTLIGPTNGPLRSLSVTGLTSGDRYRVELRNLDLDRAGGGGLALLNRVQVTLRDTLVRRSSSLLGAGVFVSGDALALIAQRTSLVLTGSSRVDDNVAGGTGGGIHCQGGAEIVLLGREVGVVGNRASSGGGIFMDNCFLNWTNASASATWGITSNEAVNAGGGIAAIDGGMVFSGAGTSGTVVATNIVSNSGVGGGISATGTQINANGLAVFANQAGSGGGLYLSGFGSVVLRRYVIAGNVAARDGGGVVFDGGDVTTVVDDAPCTLQCRAFSFNTAGADAAFAATGRGGAMLIRNAAFVELLGVNIDSNGAPVASAIDVENSDLRLVNAAIGRNVVSRPGSVVAASGANLTMLATTVAGNAAGVNQQAAIRVNGGVTSVIGSIVYERSGNAFQRVGSPVVQGACVIAHELGSLVGSALSPLLFDPLLVSDADLRLRPNSPAIDLCELSDFPEADRDIETNRRPVDDPGIANVFGSYDAGAFERLGRPIDPLFADGFE